MKILHAEMGRHLYGGALQVVLLVKGLEARGCKNTLLCPKGSAVEEALRGQSRILATSLAGALDPRLPFRLAQAVRSFRPHLLHTHSRRGVDYWGGVVAALTGTPAVVSRRVDNPEKAGLARAKYRYYDRVITVSEGVRQVLLAEGVPDGKIVCVASGIDSDRYRSVCDRQWFLREFHLDESYGAIAIIGQLIPRKGHRVLLEALPEIVREFPHVRILVFGHGPLQAELEETCRREALSSSVRFGGFRTDLERVLPCLDLVVHPAMMEGLGISLLEASAAGLPIVASRVGGIPEIVRDGVNGLLVPPGDARELARAILWLLQEPERARALGRAGRELVQREFSAARMVEGNFQVYSEVLAARGARKGAESCTWIQP